MARRPDEDRDLELIEELLFAPRGLQLQRFTQAETLAGKTADFRVLKAGNLVAFVRQNRHGTIGLMINST
jgi:hypothetical protein